MRGYKNLAGSAPQLWVWAATQQEILTMQGKVKASIKSDQMLCSTRSRA